VSCDHLLCSLSRIVIEVTINQQAKGRISQAQGAKRQRCEKAMIRDIESSLVQCVVFSMVYVYVPV